MDCLITIAILGGIIYFNREQMRHMLWGVPEHEQQTLEVDWEPVKEEEDPADQLAKLHKLHQEGVLTEKEYQIKKQELLDRM